MSGASVGNLCVFIYVLGFVFSIHYISCEAALADQPLHVWSKNFIPCRFILFCICATSMAADLLLRQEFDGGKVHTQNWHGQNSASACRLILFLCVAVCVLSLGRPLSWELEYTVQGGFY